LIKIKQQIIKNLRLMSGKQIVKLTLCLSIMKDDNGRQRTDSVTPCVDLTEDEVIDITSPDNSVIVRTNYFVKREFSVKYFVLFLHMLIVINVLNL
jgi:hypothetical protein